MVSPFPIKNGGFSDYRKIERKYIMKNLNLKALAVESTQFSELTVNREKTETDDIIKKYPDGITITGFDFVTTAKDRYPVIVFAEDDTKFFFGGYLFTKLFDYWIEKSDGTVEEVSNYLKEIGGLRLRLFKTRTKAGNSLTNFEVL